jgi:phosphoribosylformylglycinamidine cyclo-ligase
MKRVSYKDSGVDIKKADTLVRWIKKEAKKEFGQRAAPWIGAFSGCFKPPFHTFSNPVLLSTCDGVGTKLKLAIQEGWHFPIGVDLVAMCINDLTASGATPMFFFDYLSMGELDLEVAQEILSGIMAGCKESNCVLLGGETAEMPGLYTRGEYDLAGFAVGIAEEREIITGHAIWPGDVLIGLSSSGVHANGFSIIRKLLDIGLDISLRELLRPTKIYSGKVLAILQEIKVKGIAHITGGGIIGNLPRILPQGTYAEVWKGSWRVPDVFLRIQEVGRISEHEMFKTFNMGIGMILVIDKAHEDTLEEALDELEETYFRIGVIKEGKRRVKVT